MIGLLLASLASLVLFDLEKNPSAAVVERDVIRVTGDWDVSDFGELALEVETGCAKPVRYEIRLLNPDAEPVPPGVNMDYSRGVYRAVVRTTGAGRETLVRDIPPYFPAWRETASRMKSLVPVALQNRIFPSVYWNMLMKPEGAWVGMNVWTLDPHRVTAVEIRYSESCILAPEPEPFVSPVGRVKRLVARGAKHVSANPPAFATMPPDEFYPCFDRYGQFRWLDWPGKTHGDDDLRRARADEACDLAAHPGAPDRDRWGGWTKGPQLKATGGFRTEKVDGKWWIVDPDGRLWWSHGVVRVTPSSGMTPIAGVRRGYFEWLPEEGAAFSEFYRTRDELLWPYYVRRGCTNTFDFTAANLRRKYGEDWFATWADLMHRRLRSWGVNTIANSSDRRICRMDRTPYADRVELKSRPLSGMAGVNCWWPFRDPVDASFRPGLRADLGKRRAELEDPWCIGFFVDNELRWDDETSIGRWTWASSEDQPARREFVRRLKAKYGSVPKEPSEEDCRAFSRAFAELYFATVREEFKKVAPGKLYLGCRFSGSQEWVVRIAARHCDVVSFNYYRTDYGNMDAMPADLDVPVMVGEYHFGALDRGLFLGGTQSVRDQADRAETYRRYVTGALREPRTVGVHWHQLVDMPPSGRFDNGNKQIGWTDVCDTPYVETIEAVRDIGYRMYGIRYGDGK